VAGNEAYGTKHATQAGGGGSRAPHESKESRCGRDVQEEGIEELTLPVRESLQPVWCNSCMAKARRESGFSWESRAGAAASGSSLSQERGVD
jgi:hypothetical protein